MKKIACMMSIALIMITVSAYAVDMDEVQKATLYKYEIMVGDEDGNMRLDDNITRAEAVKIICTAGGIEPVGGETFSFPDVSIEHWANPYIKAAKINGIIKGDENGNFNPESNVTNEEFVKMVVCLLGYGQMAENTGGFPAGYAAVASRFGVTYGLKLDVGKAATRNDAGIMIYNALDIPLMIQNPDSEEEEYIIMDGKLYERVTLKTAFDKEADKQN